MQVRVRGSNDPFDEAIDDALNSLPAELSAAMSNVEIVVEDEHLPTADRFWAYTGAFHCREGQVRSAECFPTRSASSPAHSHDAPRATPIAYVKRSGTSCGSDPVSLRNQRRAVDRDRPLLTAGLTR